MIQLDPETCLLGSDMGKMTLPQPPTVGRRAALVPHLLKHSGEQTLNLVWAAQ